MSMFAIFVKIILIFCCKIFNIHVCNFLLTLFNLVRATNLLCVTFETIILELLTVLHL